MLGYDKYSSTANIVAKALTNYFGKDISYHHDADGAPFLDGIDMQISLSHSGNALVFALSKLTVGIDIEQQVSRNYVRLSKKLGFQCDNLLTFYDQWTAYEAKFKTKNIDLPIINLSIFDGYSTAIASNDKIIQLINITQ